MLAICLCFGAPPYHLLLILLLPTQLKYIKGEHESQSQRTVDTEQNLPPLL